MGKIRDWLLKVGSGYKVVEDYGVVDKLDSAFGLGEYQELKLLKCRLKNGEEAYVIEETRRGKFILGWEKQYFILSKDGLKRFGGIINSITN